ncbi:fibronectin type III domain-containing protein [Candidatus Woesearchaeota archaeon]|nr:fibronectin type III domain-containing protein [Candidatus Woesearchaeota archaeon]
MLKNKNSKQIEKAGIIVLMVLLGVSIVYGLEITPGSVIVTPTSNSAEINWTTNQLADGKVKYGFDIESVKTIPETGGHKIKHSVVLTGLQPATKYFFKIESTDGVNLATQATWDSFTTFLIKPNKPQAKSVEYNNITLEWTVVPQAVKYNLYVNNGLNNALFTTITDPTITTFSFLATPKTTYVFTLTAVDALNRETGFSDPLSVTTPEKLTIISFVQALKVTQNSAEVNWQTDDQSNGSVQYGLGKSSLTEFKIDKNLPDLKTIHAIKLEELESGKTYYYKVSSNNAASDIYSFTTAVNETTTLQITQVEATSITKDSAVIKWRTNLDAKGIVHYGLGDAFNLKTPEKDIPSTIHAVQLQGLLSGTTYHFKIEHIGGFAGMSSESSSFTTLAQKGVFLDVDPLPELVAGLRVNITGSTKPGAKLFIFINEDPNPQVQKIINQSSFREEILLNPLVSHDGVTGKNLIRVVSWDQQGKKDEIVLSTVIDNAPPSLEVQPLPDVTNQAEIEVKGLTDPDAEVTVFIGGSLKAKAGVIGADPSNQSTLGDAGLFAVNISLSNNNNTLRVIATDKAGNQHIFEKLIVKDITKPKLEFITEFKQKTHFKLITIEGKTDPGAKVYAANFGEFNGCDDLEFTKNFGNCRLSIGKTYSLPGTLISENVDLLGAVLGSTSTATADAEGKFTIRVPLFMGVQKLQGRNKIVFMAEDPAGNVAETSKIITYEPGCPDWRVSYADMRVYPSLIYSREITDSVVLGSVFIPLEYLGPGIPEVQVTGTNVDRNSMHDPFIPDLLKAEIEALPQSLGGGKVKNGNDMISLKTFKYSKYDLQTNRVYLYVPLQVNKYTGKIADLPALIDVYLETKLKYSVNGNLQPLCQVYPTFAYKIEKPLDYTFFLTPEMINSTIEVLDKLISSGEKISEYTKKASMYTLVGCGGLIAWNYLKSGFGGGAAESSSSGQCSQAEQDLETVYWVCDRVMCPAVPPKCDGFKHSGFTVDGKQVSDNTAVLNTAAQNKEYYNAYYARKTDKNMPMDSWLKKHAGEIKAEKNLGQAYVPMETPDIFQNQISDNKRYTVEYFDIERRKVAAGGREISITSDQDNKVVYVSDIDSAIRQKCGSGDRTLIKYTLEEQGKDSFLRGKTTWSDKEVKYECSGKTSPELGIPKAGDFIGCYSAECPAFDNTKCLADLDDVNPAKGILTSAACGCLPGVKGHVDNYVRIMKGAQQCLRQASLGEVKGGFCERLLAQFVCDLMSDVVFKSLFGTSEGSSGLLGGLFGREGVSNYKNSAGAITQQLSNRYKGIVDSRLGLSSDQLNNKICMFAVLQDWSYLEGLLGQVVDAITVEPIITVDAESRPYGFDPFTGRMMIGYYIGIGVWPGGPMSVSMRYECDPNKPNGNFCPRTSLPPRYVPGYTLKSLQRQDSINENINDVHDNSLYWYNVLVVEYKYELGGKSITKPLYVDIKRKGDLAYGCTFEVVGGIQCKGPDFLEDKFGIVQLYKMGEGTRLSPGNVPQYYPDNKVNALVKLSNRYQDPYFYLRVIPENGRSVEYQIPVISTGEASASGAPDYGGERMYNLWIDTPPALTTSQGYKTYSIEIPVIDGIFKVLADRYVGAECDDIKEKIGEGTKNVQDVLTQLKQYDNCKEDKGQKWDAAQIRLFAMSRQGTEVEIDCNTLSTDADIRDPFGFITCIDPKKEYGSEKDTSQKIYGKSISHIREIRFLNVQPSKDYADLKDFAFRFKRGEKESPENMQEMYQKIHKQHSIKDAWQVFDGMFTTYKEVHGSAGSSTIKIDILADSNENGQGDTPIWYDGKPQTLSFSYKRGDIATGLEKPLIDFIEPIGDYFNNNDVPDAGGRPHVPLGFNIWDDNNDIKKITIEIQSAGRSTAYNCAAEFIIDNKWFKGFSQNPSFQDGVNTCGIVPNPQRSTFNKQHAPSFYAFWWYPEAKATRDIETMYQITVTAADGMVKKGESVGQISTQSRQGFRFHQDKTDKQLRESDIMVCLGGGNCDIWEEARQATETISLDKPASATNVVEGQSTTVE